MSALAFSVPVFSDTTEDLVNALVTKGILTEDEAALLTKKHAGETKARDQKVKSKLSISKYPNVTIKFSFIKVFTDR